ncbi:pentatricopeptide repeat-containing protein At5g27110-like [Malania oleifera]|uniref:pentatricopeptide repeat-containing protein At5g27110-like n=1 Tax=Malania oleifera TaxID=397392 RepID=UPI0025ADA02E|nr:pentatricopeptide repeat-containing protein At5g27110-like [Malania oleifera]
MNIFIPTRSSLVAAIRRSTARKSLSEVVCIHAQIIKHGFLPEIRLYNHLLNVYSKSCDFVSARKLFDEMPEWNLVSFSTLISGYSQSGTPECALDLVPLLQNQALDMNQFVFSSLILACSKLKSVNEGKQIHAQVIVADFEFDPFVRTSLVDMYSNFDDIDSAVFVFYSCSLRDSVMYNSMISGFVRFGSHEEALELFAEGRRDNDLKPTEFTFGSVIKACSNLSMELGLQIHAFSIKTGFDADCFVGTSLVDMYSKFGDVESFKHIFHNVECIDLALLNSMIVGFSNNYSYVAAVDFFGELKLDGFNPNEFTFSSVLKACSGLKCVRLGKIIHGLIVKSEFSSDLVVNTSLLDMYLKCGSVKDSLRLLNIVPERSAVLYNAMISGLEQYGDHEGAVRLFINMKREGVVPNHGTFVSLMCSSVGHERNVYGHAIKHGLGHDLQVQNAFLDSLIKSGSVNEARWFFNNMHEKNVVSWTSIISGLSELGLNRDALRLFKELNSAGISPNSFTFPSVLKACGSLADLEDGRSIHGCSVKHGIVDEEFTSCSLLDMYARCGALEECYKLFDRMPKSDVVLWNTMITACSQYGRGHEALELFQTMKRYGVEPNHVSFTSLLSACSHCGLVEEGVQIFESINHKQNMLPSMEHYACMVDLFGRARMLERAKNLIDGMPYEPDASIWKTFLAACKLHNNLGLAEVASDHLLGLEGCDNRTLVSLSNIYSESGKWDDVERARMRMRMGEKGRKDAGLSWVQLWGEGRRKLLENSRIFLNFQYDSQPKVVELYEFMGRKSLGKEILNSKIRTPNTHDQSSYFRNKEKQRKRDWSELPDDAVDVAASRLSLPDCYRLSTVRCAWQAAAPSQEQGFRLPWLMLSKGSRSTKTRGFFCLQTCHFYQIPLPKKVRRSWRAGSSHAKTHPAFMEKVVLSSEPTPENEAAGRCVVAFCDHKCLLAACRPGDPVWPWRDFVCGSDDDNDAADDGW